MKNAWVVRPLERIGEIIYSFREGAPISELPLKTLAFFSNLLNCINYSETKKGLLVGMRIKRNAILNKCLRLGPGSVFDKVDRCWG